MKKTFLLLCLSMLLSNFSFSQNQDQNMNRDSIKYFDENYTPISKSEYENRKREKRLSSIEGDSVNHKILTYREFRGTIQNKEILDSLLASATNREIDPLKPIVIFYYPGKDPCNSTGSATRKTFRKWYDKMEKGINRIEESTILYVYRDIDGLYDKYDGFREWIKDPEESIENLFFKRYYPCNSFVVISERGEYISYYGEAPKEYIWNTLKKLVKK